eukprot:scaffold1115_cov162-Pinguiococcus_pyrenoidosus.AAC.1
MNQDIANRATGVGIQKGKKGIRPSYCWDLTWGRCVVRILGQNRGVCTQVARRREPSEICPLAAAQKPHKTSGHLSSVFFLACKCIGVSGQPVADS